MSNIPSVVDLINQNSGKTESKSAEVAAATVKQQELMKQSGELVPVKLRGPNNTLIPAFFSQAENAFLPEFEV